MMIPPPPSSIDPNAELRAAEDAERKRIEKLRAHLTSSYDPHYAREVMEHLHSDPGGVVVEEFERKWGSRGMAMVDHFVAQGLVTFITYLGEQKIRVSHLIDSAEIYKKPAVLELGKGEHGYVPWERVIYDPSCGFVLDIDERMDYGKGTWTSRALVESKGDKQFDVTVPYTTDFQLLRRTHKQLIEQGVFTATVNVFRAHRFHLIRPGVARVQLLDPDHVVADPPQAAQASLT